MEETQPVKIAKYGDRQAVFEGRAEMTKGKLKKENLLLCEKTGKYKSVKAIERGKALIQNIRKPTVVPDIEELPPTIETALEKPKRMRKKKMVEAADV